MKKMLVLFFVIFVVGLCALNNSFLSFLVQDADAEVRFYCSAKIDDFVEGVVQKKNGACFEYSCADEVAQEVFKSLNGCFGYSVHYKDSSKFQEVLNKVSVLKMETINEIINYYGVVQGAFFFNFLDNKKINVQIAKVNNAFVVGCPIILGSY